MHGKNKDQLVIVDADAIISFVYVDDENQMPSRKLALPHFPCSEHYLAKLFRRELAIKAS